MEIQLRSEISVELVQAVGDDDMIAHAAMVSVRGEEVTTPHLDPAKRDGLIAFLMKNRHGTPFEHGFMTVRVHAPIKVWREWHRHRVGWSYNEESGRYKELAPVFYIPPRDRPAIRPEGFRSARPEFVVANDEEYSCMVQDLREGYEHSYRAYMRMLARRTDRGLARDVLGVGIYSACYCSANPRSIMHFLELRTDHSEAKRPSKPLYEIRVAAEKLEALFAQQWPITYRTWLEAGRSAP